MNVLPMQSEPSEQSEQQVLPWIVINLEHRHDRMELLNKAFPDQVIERYNAVLHDDPEIGCRESHLAVIRIAKERNYPWVLILEDDCEPYPVFQTEFPKVLSYLWSHKSEWELYNGGSIPFTVRNYDKSILQIENWIAAQFIIVNSSAYDKLLNHDSTKHAKKIDDFVL